MGEKERCGIILAAGDGVRFRPPVRRLEGDALPKQYVNVVGSRSLLEQTFDRAERLIPSHRLFTVAGRHHLSHREANSQLTTRPKGTVILQPENKESVAELLLPLMQVYARYPESVVVVFPSNHFVREENLFMGCVDLACRAVEQEADRFVLLGMEPYRPVSEYGYILPGRRTPNGTFSSLKRVVGFIEKPPPPLVEDLIRRGALWNTFVMVSRVRQWVDLIHRLVPKFFHPFERIRRAIETKREQDVVDEVYRTLTPVNFSKEVLERLPWDDPLRPFVLPMRGVFWSDPGSERRLVEDLHKAADMNRIKQVVNG